MILNFDSREALTRTLEVFFEIRARQRGKTSVRTRRRTVRQDCDAWIIWSANGEQVKVPDCLRVEIPENLIIAFRRAQFRVQTEQNQLHDQEWAPAAEEDDARQAKAKAQAAQEDAARRRQ